MKKGITPIIAVIILLLITVALAGMAWVFLSNYFSGLTSKNIQLIDYSCVGNNARVVVKNAGTSTISLASCSVSGAVLTCTDMTVIKTTGGNIGTVAAGTGFGGATSLTTTGTTNLATFNDSCTGTCTYRFSTPTGAGGPSPNVATVNC